MQGVQESNPPKWFWRPVYYRYTNPLEKGGSFVDEIRHIDKGRGVRRTDIKKITQLPIVYGNIWICKDGAELKRYDTIHTYGRKKKYHL